MEESLFEDPAMDPPAGPRFPSEIPRFVRPVLPDMTFYSDDGEPIPYGNRWGADGPPSDSYSVVSHPERFAGLHLVADALLSHLAKVYDVDVDDSLDHAADLLRQGMEPLRAVRVTPQAPDAAPLTFVFTDFPGLAVHAGLLHDFIHPDCGCDACDETLERSADELERLVHAVAAGSYREWLGRGREGGMSLILEDGASGRGGDLGPVPETRLEAARARLRQLPDGWQPWPLRGD